VSFLILYIYYIGKRQINQAFFTEYQENFRELSLCFIMDVSQTIIDFMVMKERGSRKASVRKELRNAVKSAGSLW